MMHFFHGLIGDHRHFSTVVAKLAGHVGACKVPDIGYLDHDFPTLVRDMQSKTLLPGVRVGNSVGCSLALKTAGDDDQLILTAPPFDYSKGSVPLRKALVRDWVKSLYVSHGKIPGEAAFLAHATTQLEGLLESPAQIKRLRHYKAVAQAFWDDPLLLVHQERITFVIGAADFTTPVDAFVPYVRDHLPMAKVEVWPNCGHAVSLDAPDQLAALIQHKCLKIKMNMRTFAKSA